jgi:DNA-binding response OmpR family regulator
MVGFDTIQARSTSSARSALASQSIDLIILDLAADAGSMAFLRELRRDGARQDLPVIVLTSSARESDRIDARAAGAAAFLTKPVSTRELLSAVNGSLALRGGVPLRRFPHRHEPRPGRAISPTQPVR